MSLSAVSLPRMKVGLFSFPAVKTTAPASTQNSFKLALCSIGLDQESMQRDKFLPTYISSQPPIFQLRRLCSHPARKPLLSYLQERKRVREDCFPQAKIILCE